MGIIELLFVAVSLSMDAFAVAACIGLGLTGDKDFENSKNINKKSLNLKNALIVGLYFGFFQAVMPLIGYFTGIRFYDIISDFDYLIAFLLLSLIGGKMIKDSFDKSEQSKKSDKCLKCVECVKCGKSETSEKPEKSEDAKESEESENKLKIKKMLPLAIATSIDALALGISFAFLDVNIFTAVSIIGVITFALSAAGVKIGSIFGTKFKSKSELAGGIVLIAIGLKIVSERLFL